MLQPQVPTQAPIQAQVALISQLFVFLGFSLLKAPVQWLRLSVIKVA